MKRLKNKEIEAKLRAMYLNKRKDEIIPLETMKRRAAFEYHLRQRNKSAKSKSGTPHRLVIALSIGICLILGSFLFSVFAPTVISSANNFMRRAVFWINDVFQLGIEVERPLEIEDDGMNRDVKTDFASVEEASKHFALPLLVLRDPANEFTLTPPKAELGIEPFYMLYYSYSSGKSVIRFEYEHILTDTSINLRTVAEEYDTKIGTFFAQENADNTVFITTYNDFILRIVSTLALEDSLLLINDCQWLN